ncbi:hypothetical protein [Pseudomonas sp. PL-6]
MSADFHKLAKDAGNQLKNYILTYASAATGVFFLTLAGKEALTFTYFQKTLLISGLLLYVITVICCLIELRVDARRFFYIAKQLEKPESEQDWSENEPYKKLRLRLIYGSYVAISLATLSVVIFLITAIT